MHHTHTHMQLNILLNCECIRLIDCSDTPPIQRARSPAAPSTSRRKDMGEDNMRTIYLGARLGCTCKCSSARSRLSNHYWYWPLASARALTGIRAPFLHVLVKLPLCAMGSPYPPRPVSPCTWWPILECASGLIIEKLGHQVAGLSWPLWGPRRPMMDEAHRDRTVPSFPRTNNS